MNAAWLAVITLVLFALGYRFYSSFLSKQIFELADDEPVPSREFEDGVDFVPTRKDILWGHHYTSIAGAAPIVGPAIAGGFHRKFPRFETVAGGQPRLRPRSARPSAEHAVVQ